MKVQFDSNTWRLIVSPEDFTTDPDYVHCQKIHEAIVNGKIEAYLSETIFTTEAIVRKKRQGYFAKMSPKVKHKESTSGNTTTLSFILGPNEDDAILFDSTIQILKDYFDKAISLGFRIVRLPRMGGLVNPDVDKVAYKVVDFHKYNEQASEVGEKIEACGAGFSWLKEIGEKYDPDWLKGIKKAPDAECNHIAKAAAEWADGDSVAICIGLECDYFCTRDQARGAGQKSVFSQSNLSWLEEKNNFKTIGIEPLSNLI